MDEQSLQGMDIIRSYVVGQAQLDYLRFDPEPNASDVLLATFPKSGSTWTSYLLHQIRSSCDDTFDDIKHEVVDITPGHWDPALQPLSIAQKFSPRTYKTHGSYARSPKGAKTIYVSRDPKDIFWSLYMFIHDLLGIQERVPLDLFYREYFVERFNSGHDIGNVWDHLLGWYTMRGKPTMLWLHYEDLVASRERALRLIAEFIGVRLDDEHMGQLILHSQMEHMRGISKQLDPSPDNYVGKLVKGFGELSKNYARKMRVGKLRRGIPGDGEKDLPDELKQEIDKQWRQRITPVLGFSDYSEMKAANGLPA